VYVTVTFTCLLGPLCRSWAAQRGWTAGLHREETTAPQRSGRAPPPRSPDPPPGPLYDLCRRNTHITLQRSTDSYVVTLRRLIIGAHISVSFLKRQPSGFSCISRTIYCVCCSLCNIYIYIYICTYCLVFTMWCDSKEIMSWYKCMYVSMCVCVCVCVSMYVTHQQAVLQSQGEVCRGRRGVL